MINFADFTKENIKAHNPNWLQIPDHPYRILISHQSDIDKINLHAKDPYETKYQLLINREETTYLKQLNDFKAFIEY